MSKMMSFFQSSLSQMSEDGSADPIILPGCQVPMYSQVDSMSKALPPSPSHCHSDWQALEGAAALHAHRLQTDYARLVAPLTPLFDPDNPITRSALNFLPSSRLSTSFLWLISK